MEEHVTVIPGDDVISVGGIPMQFKFPPVAGHEKVHAIQWHEGNGTLELDGFISEPLTAADYDRAVAPYVQFWETEKARREAEKAEQEAEYNKLENVKARKLAELSRAMEEAKVSSSVSILSSTGYTVNANTTAKQNVDGVITTMTATGREVVGFMTYDNQLINMTLEQLKTIQLELISYGNNLYARKWALRSQIEACKTKEEVDAVVIDYSDVTA